MDIIRDYLGNVAATIERLPRERIVAVLDELMRAYREDRTVFVFGNGGSAATASHFACDLCKGTIAPGDRPRLRAVALTDSVPLLTAWGNDADYAAVFAEQIRNLGRSKDVALAISGSGNSPNVLRGVEVARALGMVTIGLSGFAGGKLSSLVDVPLVVANHDMLQIEDAHLVVCHAMTTWLRETLATLPEGARAT